MTERNNYKFFKEMLNFGIFFLYQEMYGVCIIDLLIFYYNLFNNKH